MNKKTGTKIKKISVTKNIISIDVEFYVEFIEFKEGIVYVKMLGACIGCSSIDITVKDGIEAMLLEEVPGVIGVELVLS